eukprot:Em0018g276a
MNQQQLQQPQPPEKRQRLLCISAATVASTEEPVACEECVACEKKRLMMDFTSLKWECCVCYQPPVASFRGKGVWSWVCNPSHSDAAVRPPTVKTVKLGDTVGLTAVTVRKSE